MNSASRPKIHRLPVSVVRKPSKVKASAQRLGLAVTVLMVMSIAAAIGVQCYGVYQKSTPTVAMLPQISVGVQDGGVDASLIGDAQAAGHGALVDKSNKIISLHGDSEYIIGQMAKIPAENEQITEIKAVNDIDNHAGRELLSIISKY